jgi:hypothetical protein
VFKIEKLSQRIFDVSQMSQSHRSDCGGGGRRHQPQKMASRTALDQRLGHQNGAESGVLARAAFKRRHRGKSMSRM